MALVTPIGRWLDALARQDELGVKLRVLLLEREAPKGFGWWFELTRPASQSAAERRDLFYDPQLRPQELTGLDDVEARRRIVAKALAATQKLYGSDGQAIPEAGIDIDFDERLSKPVFSNPLSLIMVGVIACSRGVHAALALRRLDAARHLAARELARFARLARDDAEARALRHLVAFNSIAGGLPYQGLNGTIAAELHEVGIRCDAAGVAELLQQELPARAPQREELGGAPRLGTIQPDLIGEGVVVAAFEATPARQAEAPEAIRRAYALTRSEAAHALVRLLQDYAYAVADPKANQAERETGGRLLEWLRKLVERVEDVESLEPLALALLTQSLVLKDIALDLTRRLVEATAVKPEETDNRRLYQAMLWSAMYGIRLADLGHPEDALIWLKLATAHARRLCQIDAGHSSRIVAASLHNWALALSSLGEHRAALPAIEEALEIYHRLPRTQTSTFLPSLAVR